MQDRKGMLNYKLSEKAQDVSEETQTKIAKETEGFCGADIDSMVNECKYAMREKKLEKQTDEILLEAFDSMKAGINLDVNF